MQLALPLAEFKAPHGEFENAPSLRGHPSSLTKLVCLPLQLLHGSTNLTKVTLSPLSACPKLQTLDLSGCSKLRTLLIQSSSLTSLNISGCSALTKVRRDDFLRPQEKCLPVLVAVKLHGLTQSQCYCALLALQPSGCCMTRLAFFCTRWLGPASFKACCASQCSKPAPFLWDAAVGETYDTRPPVLLQVLIQCPNLERLEMADCTGLKEMLLWSDKLTELDATSSKVSWGIMILSLARAAAAVCLCWPACSQAVELTSGQAPPRLSGLVEGNKMPKLAPRCSRADWQATDAAHIQPSRITTSRKEATELAATSREMLSSSRSYTATRQSDMQIVCGWKATSPV